MRLSRASRLPTLAPRPLIAPAIPASAAEPPCGTCHTSQQTREPAALASKGSEQHSMTQQLYPARDQKGEKSQSGFSRQACSDYFVVSCRGEVCSRLLSVMLWSSLAVKMCCVRMCCCMQARLATMRLAFQCTGPLCSMCCLCNRHADHVCKDVLGTPSNRLFQCFDGAARRRLILKAVSERSGRLAFVTAFVKG